MTTKYETEDPEIIFASLKRLAKEELHSGAKRVSVRKLIEVTRSTLKAKVNNNDMTPMTDRLLDEVPELKGKIVTRERGARGKNKAKAAKDNATSPGLSTPQVPTEIDQLRTRLAMAHERGLVMAHERKAAWKQMCDWKKQASETTETALASLRAELAQAKSDRDFLIDILSRTTKAA